MQRFLDEEIFFLGDYHYVKGINYIRHTFNFDYACCGCNANKDFCFEECPILDWRILL